jgi:D-glycerate 3-kinase
VTKLVHDKLSNQPGSPLNVCTLSIDDLYLPHAALVELASQKPINPLWSGRGQPGTHDVSLGVNILESLHQLGETTIEGPRFEKSLFNGEGDRLPPGHGTLVQPPVDVVIMEGWCMGFYPISSVELDQRWDSSWVEESQKLGLRLDLLGTKNDIVKINAKLQEYIRLWSYFDIFVQVCLQFFSFSMSRD